MNTYLSHTSALEWLARTPEKALVLAASDHRRRLPRRNGAGIPCAGKASRAVIDGLAASGVGCLAVPVHVLVPSDRCRTRCAAARCHVRSGGFPAHSFIPAAADTFSSSPELAFVQMAETLDSPRLVKLGDELCGTYGIETVGIVDFDRESPFTTIERLERFLVKAERMPGLEKARRAARRIAPGSASPMETAVILLFCLPPRLGGYGLPLPAMNGRANLKKQAGLKPSDKRYRCDLLWADAGIAVEYDSFLHHSSRTELANDARRRNDLLARNVTVVSITGRTVWNLIELDRIARLLAKRLGKRLNVGGSGWRKAQHELHGMLTGPFFSER